MHAFIGLFWGGQQRATLWVHKFDSPPTLPNVCFEAAGATRYYARFRETAMPPLIDTLRNETPVYFQYSPESDGAFISTRKEPVTDWVFGT